MLPMNLLMLSELEWVNVSDSLRCLVLAIIPVMGVSARTTLEGAAKCAMHCELQVSLLVSWCHHTAGFPVFGGIGNVWFSVWLSAAAVPSHSSITHGHERWSVG